MTRTLPLPEDATRLVVAGLVTFWLLLFVAVYTVTLVTGPVRWLVAVAFVAIWAGITVTWVRRTGDTESNVWGAVSRSQALGRYAESGGVTVTEQRASLSNDEE